MEFSYPQYYHIGLPKTGTTTIQHILRSDDRINLIGNRYFNKFDYWKRPYTFLKEGKLNIVSEENQILQMDNFGKLSLLLSRIQRCAPAAHIIITIREQRDLLESRYKYNFPWYGGYSKDFQFWLESGQGMDYLSICMFSSIYDSILAFFPKEQIHFLLFEDLKFDYNSFLADFYGILNLQAPPGALTRRIVKNESISESELLILKRLNRFKLFKADNKLARYELQFFKRVAGWLANPVKKYDAFRWNGIVGREKIEQDFARENSSMVKSGILSGDKLKKYNYLLD